jgi:hypothetical protein
MRRRRVPFAIIGGIAVGFLGQPRVTLDVDAVALIDDRQWPKWLRQTESFGFAPRVGDVLAFAAASRVFLLRHTATGMNVAFPSVDCHSSLRSCNKSDEFA